VVNWKNQFSVAIIPYTYEHTNFKEFSVGTKVNLEFDVIENMFRDYTATNKLSITSKKP
jgi:riboflavin synthase alpha subunit